MWKPREDTPEDRLASYVMNNQAAIRARRQSKDLLLMDYADIRDIMKYPIQFERLKFAIDVISKHRTIESLREELADVEARIRLDEL